LRRPRAHFGSAPPEGAAMAPASANMPAEPILFSCRKSPSRQPNAPLVVARACAPPSPILFELSQSCAQQTSADSVTSVSDSWRASSRLWLPSYLPVRLRQLRHRAARRRLGEGGHARVAHLALVYVELLRARRRRLRQTLCRAPSRPDSLARALWCFEAPAGRACLEGGERAGRPAADDTRERVVAAEAEGELRERGRQRGA
jgi:hypothetical protein